MCYYERYEYPCGCWKWGNFRQHCQKEYRIGETCGLRLSLGSAAPLSENCSHCEKRARKQRRLEKLMSDIQRWHGDSARKASYEKACGEAKDLRLEIHGIDAEIHRRKMNLGRTR